MGERFREFVTEAGYHAASPHCKVRRTTVTKIRRKRLSGTQYARK
jgi:hypothetical protein